MSEAADLHSLGLLVGFVFRYSQPYLDLASLLQAAQMVESASGAFGVVLPSALRDRVRLMSS